LYLVLIYLKLKLLLVLQIFEYFIEKNKKEVAKFDILIIMLYLLIYHFL